MKILSKRAFADILCIGTIELFIFTLILTMSGYGLAVIISPSMEPVLMTNAVIITKNTAYEDIQVGDIVHFSTAEYGYVMHRVMYIQTTNEGITGLHTKGYNNEYYDNFAVAKEDYYNEVVGSINFLAPLITLIFGSFMTPNYLRIFFGVLILGVGLLMTLGTITNLIYKAIMKGVMIYETKHIRK